MDTATRVQILNETDCISHSTNTLGKGMNPLIPINEYPRYDTKQSDGDVQECWGFGEYGAPFIAIAPRSTQAGVIAPDRALPMG